MTLEVLDERSTSTATWRLDEEGTKNLKTSTLCAVSEVVRVVLLGRDWSIPTRLITLPAGQSTMGST